MSANPVAVIEAQNPPHAAFLTLRRELGRLLDEASTRNQGLIADLIINMERWRWLPRQLGSSFVMVSVPEYLVRVIDTGRLAYQGRVIVGQQTTPTPLFRAKCSISWSIRAGRCRRAF